MPPEQVVGTVGGVTYTYGANGKPELIKDPNSCSMTTRRENPRAST